MLDIVIFECLGTGFKKYWTRFQHAIKLFLEQSHLGEICFFKLHFIYYYYYFFFWPCHVACRILVSKPEIKPGSGYAKS